MATVISDFNSTGNVGQDLRYNTTETDLLNNVLGMISNLVLMRPKRNALEKPLLIMFTTLMSKVSKIFKEDEFPNLARKYILADAWKV